MKIWAIFDNFSRVVKRQKKEPGWLTEKYNIERR